MKSLAGIFRSLLLSSSLFLAVATAAHAVGEPRSCVVKEVLKGGMYVYLRCQEKGKDIWMATVAREFRTDEVVRFVDAPPMVNFYSKYLDRTFPEVIFTDLLPPEGKTK